MIFRNVPFLKIFDFLKLFVFENIGNFCFFRKICEVFVFSWKFFCAIFFKCSFFENIRILWNFFFFENFRNLFLPQNFWNFCSFVKIFLWNFSKCSGSENLGLLKFVIFLKIFVSYVKFLIFLFLREIFSFAKFFWKFLFVKNFE